MTADTPEHDAPAVDVFDDGIAGDPHPLYAQLRQHRINPSASAESFFTISRYDDVRAGLRAPETFSSGLEAITIGQDRPLIPLQVDPPEHAKYRRLLDPHFGPKEVVHLDGDCRKLTNELIDTFIDEGAVDFHDAFSVPLPCTIFLQVLGLPLDDLELFLTWKDMILRPDLEDPSDIEAGNAVRRGAAEAIYEYFGKAIDSRSSRPRDDLLTQLVRAEVEGHRLTRNELLDICFLLLLAGLDTVTASLDCFFAYLAAAPDQRRRLVDDPDRSAGAVEELLRTETPVMGVLRVAACPVTAHGVELDVTDHLTMMLGSANTDERQFPDADRVDFDREPNRHLAFGAGPHRCLGSHLARLELRVALEEWHRRIPDYQIPAGTQLAYSTGIRSISPFPIEFSA